LVGWFVDESVVAFGNQEKLLPVFHPIRIDISVPEWHPVRSNAILDDLNRCFSPDRKS
jgi:hypothetical protein